MGKRWSAQYGLPAKTELEARTMFHRDAANDAEFADPDKVGTTPEGPLSAQAETGDAHSVFEEYRGYILDGGGLNGAGANGHAGGHIRLDPARKEILLEVDRAAVLNNLPAGGIAAVMNGASGVFSNATRGAGIYMYWLMDEVTLAAPTAVDLNAGFALSSSRDTAINRPNVTTTALATDFIHVLFVDANLGQSAGTKDSGDLLSRGAMISVSEMNERYKLGNRYGVTNIPEAYMTVMAHEITHMLFEKVSVGVWDESEHVTGPLETYEAELMYQPPTKKNRELSTVKISPVVQQEIKVKENQGIV